MPWEPISVMYGPDGRRIEPNADRSFTVPSDGVCWVGVIVEGRIPPLVQPLSMRQGDRLTSVGSVELPGPDAMDVRFEGVPGLSRYCWADEWNDYDDDYDLCGEEPLPDGIGLCARHLAALRTSE